MCSYQPKALLLRLLMSQHRLSHSKLREGVRVHSMHSISYHNAHCMHRIHDIFSFINGGKMTTVVTMYVREMVRVRRLMPQFIAQRVDDQTWYLSKSSLLVTYVISVMMRMELFPTSQTFLQITLGRNGCTENCVQYPSRVHKCLVRNIQGAQLCSVQYPGQTSVLCSIFKVFNIQGT